MDAQRNADDIAAGIQRNTGDLCPFISSPQIQEDKVLEVLRILIRDGVNIGECSDHTSGGNALHCSAERKFKRVTQKLFEQGLDLFAQNNQNKCPITVAIETENDILAEMMITKACERGKKPVRELMKRSENGDPQINLGAVLRKKLPKTTVALLDCLQEFDWKQTEKTEVFYSVLEADGHGYEPDKEFFCDDKADKTFNTTPFHLMVTNQQQDYLFHPVLQSLLERKWNRYGKKWYWFRSLLFLWSLIWISVSMWASVFTNNVLKYDRPFDYFRAVAELLAYPCAIVSLVIEFGQVISFGVRSYFFVDKFNWLEMASSMLLISVLPVRLTHVEEHWYVFSVGYLFWCVRAFKYATLWRAMGVYIDILWQLVLEVFPSFAVLFTMLNLAFGGAFVLFLKGDGNLDVNYETSSFRLILLTGLRSLIQGDSMVDDYVGKKGYKFFSCLTLLIFLFMIIVVLLNILIAQLSEALPRALKNVDKNLNFKKAHIIYRVDRSPVHKLWNRIRKRKPNRRAYYVANDVIEMDKLMQQVDETQ